MCAVCAGMAKRAVSRILCCIVSSPLFVQSMDHYSSRLYNGMIYDLIADGMHLSLGRSISPKLYVSFFWTGEVSEPLFQFCNFYPVVNLWVGIEKFSQDSNGKLDIHFQCSTTTTIYVLWSLLGCQRY